MYNPFWWLEMYDWFRFCKSVNLNTFIFGILQVWIPYVILILLLTFLFQRTVQYSKVSCYWEFDEFIKKIRKTGKQLNKEASVNWNVAQAVTVALPHFHHWKNSCINRPKVRFIFLWISVLLFLPNLKKN